MCLTPTWRSSNPSQAKHTVVKVPVGKDVGQAVVIVVLFRIKFQELLHSNVWETKRIRIVLFDFCGIYLENGNINKNKAVKKNVNEL